jgi:hypothetical protein
MCGDRCADVLSCDEAWTASFRCVSSFRRHPEVRHIISPQSRHRHVVTESDAHCSRCGLWTLLGRVRHTRRGLLTSGRCTLVLPQSARTNRRHSTTGALNRTRTVRQYNFLSPAAPGSGLLTAPLGHRLTLPTTAMRRADTCDTTQLAGTHAAQPPRTGTYSSLLSAMACGSRAGSVGAVSSLPRSGAFLLGHWFRSKRGAERGQDGRRLDDQGELVRAARPKVAVWVLWVRGARGCPRRRAQLLEMHQTARCAAWALRQLPHERQGRRRA